MPNLRAEIARAVAWAWGESIRRFTFRCWRCGVSELKRGYVSQGELAGLCGRCYGAPTPFGWPLGDMMQPGALARWWKWIRRTSFEHWAARIAMMNSREA